MFLSRYNDRPATLKVERELTKNMVIDLENEAITKVRTAKVYALNEFDISVWDDGEVTAQKRYYAKSDPQSTFPNMTIESGSINLPIEDLVSFLLLRIRPEELAEGLLPVKEVRELLYESLAKRYASDYVDDEQRRKFLADIKQSVTSVALDRAVSVLNHEEEARRCRSDYYRWRAIEIGCYKTLYAWAAAQPDFKPNLHITPESLAGSISEQRDPIMNESVGKQWHESRDFWRQKLEEIYLNPMET